MDRSSESPRRVPLAALVQTAARAAARIGNVLLAACLVGAAVIGCSGGHSSGLPQVGVAPTESQSCSRDRECILVDDCCGCEGGGVRLAVHRDHLEQLTESAGSECAGRQCTDQASNHRSCTAVQAVCRGGRCIPAL